MTDKGKRKSTEAQKKAGAENLRRWQEQEGQHLQALKHGIYSTTKRQRFTDLRTQEGQWLKTVTTQLVDV